MRTVVYDHQIFSQQQFGGISRYFCELAAHIHRMPGLRARVVAPLHFNSYLPSCEVAKSGIYLRKAVPKSGPIYRTVNALISPLILRARPASLIHQTYYGPAPARLKLPVVVTVFDMIHELFPQDFAADDRVRHNKRLSVARADHVLCISHSTARDLVRVLGVDKAKISVTHLGYSATFDTDTPASESARQARPYLLYVGLRDGYKNFSLALEAYAGSEWLKREFDFVAFGGHPFSDDEKGRFAYLGLSADRVTHRRGSDSELAVAYRHARVLVYPSKYEGFGIPPLEAMRSGCVVACSNASSIPEVVGDAALLFDPHDVAAIQRSLEQACSDERTRNRLVQAGRLRATQFSWERCANETAAAYRALLAD